MQKLQRGVAGLTILSFMVIAKIVVGQGTDGVIVLDINGAIEMALQLNPNLKLARANEDKTEALIQEVTSRALPQLSLRSSFTRNLKRPVFFIELGDEVQKIEIGSKNAYIGALQFEQTIFDHGQFWVKKARQISGLVSEVSREGTELTRDEVLFNVRRAFYMVLLSQRVLAVFHENLAQAEAHLKNVQEQYNEGMAAEFDLLRSEVDVAEAKAALIEVENNVRLAMYGLKNAIGLPLQRKINLSGALEYNPISEGEISQLSKLGLESRPEMKQLRLRLEIARLNTDIQKGSRWPSLSFNSNYQFQGQSSDLQFGALERSTSLVAGLDLRVNIFDGFETSARIQKAQAEANEVLHQMERVRQQVEIEIEQAVLRMKAARERIEAQQKSVEQAEKANRIAEVRYDNGISTQLELFDARLALNRTKTNYLQAIYDYNIALFEWQKAAGVIQ